MRLAAVSGILVTLAGACSTGSGNASPDGGDDGSVLGGRHDGDAAPAGDDAGADAGDISDAGDAGGSASDAGGSDGGSDAGQQLDAACADQDDDGVTLCDDDCDDDPGACGDACFPGNAAPDTCDGDDQDCDGNVDEDPEFRFYADGDSDGFGDAADALLACTAPADHVADATDCNDGSDAIHPAAAEDCDDAVDNDCDAALDCEDDACVADLACAACVDADGDGWFALGTCPGAADCDDSPGNCGAECFPGNEPDVCGDKGDNDCDGVTSEDPPLWYYDEDGDDHGLASPTVAQCNRPDGYGAELGDCAPTDNLHWADCGACADTDGDARGTGCDLGADCAEGDPGLYADTMLYEDLDRDGIGSANVDVLCLGQVRPVGYTPFTGDCDDTNLLRVPGAVEIPGDGIDNDCGLDGDPAIDDASTVYLSATDGNDANAGTHTSPVQTLAAALTLARGAGKAIAIDEGTYASGVTTLTIDVALLGGFSFDGATAWTRDIGSYLSGITGQGFEVASLGAGSLWGVTVQGSSSTRVDVLQSKGVLLAVDSVIRGATTTDVSHKVLYLQDTARTDAFPSTAILVRSEIMARNGTKTNAIFVAVDVARSAHLAVEDGTIAAGGCIAAACPYRSVGIEVGGIQDLTSTLVVKRGTITGADVQVSYGVRVRVDASAELVGARVSTPNGIHVQEGVAVHSSSSFLRVRDSVLTPGTATAESTGLDCEDATVVNSYVYGGTAPNTRGLWARGSVKAAHAWFAGGDGTTEMGIDADGSLLLANSIVISGAGTGTSTGLDTTDTTGEVTLSHNDFFGPGCPVNDGACHATVDAIEGCTFAGCTGATGILLGNPNAVLMPGGERVLQMGSICIDAGLDASASFSEDDLSKDFLSATRPALTPDLGPTEAE